MITVIIIYICLGMQHYVIEAAQPYGLGLNETLLPQHLKQLGYATHAVGKVKHLALLGITVLIVYT